MTINDTVTDICDYAFSNCPKLKHVVLPTSLKKIYEYAFANDSIETVVIQSTNLHYVFDGAFKSNLLKYFILRGDTKEIYIDVFNENFDEIYDLFTINKHYNMREKYHSSSFIKDRFNIDIMIYMISNRYNYTIDHGKMIYKCKDIIEFTEECRSTFD